MFLPPRLIDVDHMGFIELKFSLKIFLISSIIEKLYIPSQLMDL